MTSRALASLAVGGMLVLGMAFGLVFCAASSSSATSADGWTVLQHVAPVARLLRGAAEAGLVEADGGFVTGSGRRPGLTAHLGPTADAPLDVAMPGGRSRLRVRRVGASASPGLRRGAVVVYPGAWSGADVAVFQRSQSVEELVLARRSGTPIEYEVDLPEGWSLVSLTSHVAEVRDPHGAGQARVRADRAWDADGVAVSVRLTVSGARLRVEPASWGDAPVIVDPTWESVGVGLVVPRELHSATALSNGAVAVIGGFGQGDAGADAEVALGSVEVLDPTGSSFTLTDGGLEVARAGHTATPLLDGRVLIAGGTPSPGADPLASTELYDPGAGTFTTGPTMTSPRVGHTATRLPDGTVLIAGGETEGATESPTASADLYDPVSNKITATTNGMLVARAFHTASLLPDGRVVLGGGSVSDGTLEIYSGGVFAEAKDAHGNVAKLELRRDHLAFVDAPDDAVYFTGGTALAAGASNPVQVVQQDEVLDLATLTVSRPPPSPCQVAGTCSPVRFAAGTALTDRALVVGGEIDTPGDGGASAVSGVTNAVTSAPFPATGDGVAPALSFQREHHTVTPLPNGALLVVGGTGSLDDPGDNLVQTVERLLPDEPTVVASHVPMSTARFLHSSTLLPSGHVLVAGGCSLLPSSEPTTLGSAEIYVPPTADGGGDLFLPPVAMSAARAGHTATALPDGRVLLVGGTIPGGGVGAEIFAESSQPPSTPLTAPALVGCVEHTATLLLDGTVLVVGGACPDKSTGHLVPTGAGFIIDPGPPSVIPLTNGLNVPRQSHVAVRLADGTVLIAGGVGTGESSSGPNAYGVKTTEIYDPVARTFTENAVLKYARVDPSAVLLDGAQVLISGGADPSMGGGLAPLPYTEILTTTPPVSNAGPNLIVARSRHSAIPLPDGRVAFVGGDCPVPPAYALADDPKGMCDNFAAIGQYACGGGFHSQVELYDPNPLLPSFSLGSGAPIVLGGTGEQAAVTLMATGDLLVTGGNDAYPLDSAEIASIRSSPVDPYLPTLVGAGAVSVPGGPAVVISGTAFAGILDRSGGSPAGGRLGVLQATWVPISTGLAIPTAVGAWDSTSAQWFPPVSASLGPGVLFPVVDGLRGAGVFVAVGVAPVGQPCDVGSECARTFCVGGVCCESACNGTCQQCSTGSCELAPAGAADPVNCKVSSSSCGNTGACTASGTCAQAEVGAACPEGVCSAPNTCIARCDAPDAGAICRAYHCVTSDETDGGVGAGLCTTSCASNGDCADGAVCTLHGTTGSCAPFDSSAAPGSNGCAISARPGGTGVPIWVGLGGALWLRRSRVRRTAAGRRGSTRGTARRAPPAPGG